MIINILLFTAVLCLLYLLVATVLETLLSYQQRRANAGLAEYLCRKLSEMERSCPKEQTEVLRTIKTVEQLIHEYESGKREKKPGGEPQRNHVIERQARFSMARQRAVH